MKNSKKYNKKVNELNKNEVVDEIFPDVDHDIEGVTFEGKPLSAWSVDGLLNSLDEENENDLSN